MRGDQFVVAVIISLTHLPVFASAIRCYKCTTFPPQSSSNETTRLCSNFDYSDHYEVDCPYSTFCMKRAYTVNIKGPINGTVRDCAPQRYDYQDYKNGKWQMEVSIEEPYSEGCSTDDDKGQRLSKTTYCYCRSDLCNSSNGLSMPHIPAVIFVYIIKIIFDVR